MNETTDNTCKAGLKNAGRCAVILLIIMGLSSIGTLWLFVTQVPKLQEELAQKKAGQKAQQDTEHDWKALSNKLKKRFSGRITSIEQLNSTTCWAVLSSGISEREAESIAGEIGYYIKASLGGTKGAPPLIHVFVDNKRVATARLSGKDYTSEVDIQNWSPSEYQGRYRP